MTQEEKRSQLEMELRLVFRSALPRGSDTAEAEGAICKLLAKQLDELATAPAFLDRVRPQFWRVVENAAWFARGMAGGGPITPGCVEQGLRAAGLTGLCD